MHVCLVLSPALQVYLFSSLCYLRVLHCLVFDGFRYIGQCDGQACGGHFRFVSF